MKVRKVKNIVKTLKKKGFVEERDGHHALYYLYVDGLKTTIYTYMSHGPGSKDYGKKLMGQVKKQLKFEDTKKAERFLDCPMKEVEYVEMLRDLGEV